MGVGDSVNKLIGISNVKLASYSKVYNLLVDLFEEW